MNDGMALTAKPPKPSREVLKKINHELPRSAHSRHHHRRLTGHQRPVLESFCSYPVLEMEEASECKESQLTEP